MNANNNTDIDLLRLSAQKDESAFTLLYKKYSPIVYTFALRILENEILAEEIMHEIMLKIWQIGEKANDIENLEAYLRVTARNASLNLLRRQEIERRAKYDQINKWTEEHQDTEERVLLNDAKRILDEAILLLPPQQQQVFRLCHLQNLKYEEAAKEMGLSPLTVATHMKLALRFVRAYMKKSIDIFAILLILKLI